MPRAKTPTIPPDLEQLLTALIDQANQPDSLNLDGQTPTTANPPEIYWQEKKNTKLVPPSSCAPPPKNLPSFPIKLNPE